MDPSTQNAGAPLGKRQETALETRARRIEERNGGGGARRIEESFQKEIPPEYEGTPIIRPGRNLVQQPPTPGVDSSLAVTKNAGGSESSFGASSEERLWRDLKSGAQLDAEIDYDPNDPLYNYQLFRSKAKEKETRRKLKSMMSLFCDELPCEELAVEELKEAGNRLYLEKDYESANEFFTKAILLFESRFYENCPRDNRSKVLLSILYSNRCQCYLMLARNCQGGEFFDPRKVKAEVRYWALRASRDAVMSYTLDPLNAKAHHKRGQALLLLSSMQPRSKAAIAAFERALKIGTLPDSTRAECLQWLQYSKARFDEETPLPVSLQGGGCKQQ